MCVKINVMSKRCTQWSKMVDLKVTGYNLYAFDRVASPEGESIHLDHNIAAGHKQNQHSKRNRNKSSFERLTDTKNGWMGGTVGFYRCPN